MYDHKMTPIDVSQAYIFNRWRVGRRNIEKDARKPKWKINDNSNAK